MSAPRLTGRIVAFWFAIGVGQAAAANVAQQRRVVAIGTRPESVTRGFGSRWFVTVMNDKLPGDGVVKVLERDGVTATTFAAGFDEPKGICFTGTFLVTTDVKKVWKIDAQGQKTVLADEAAFPQPPSYLNDTACEVGGKAVYVSDMGANTKARDGQGNLWPLDSPEAKALPAVGRIYRITLDGKVALAVDSRPDMPCPNGVANPSQGRLLIGEFFTGNILQAKAGRLTTMASGLRGADGVEQDHQGNIYVSSWTQGKIWRIPAPVLHQAAAAPTLIAEGFQSAADFYLDEKAKLIVLPDMKAGTLTFLSLP